MNATRGNTTEAFFKELLLLSEELRIKGKSFFLTRANANVNTYYIRREKTKLNKSDFEMAGCTSFESFESTLSAMWVEQGYPELVTLLTTLSQLEKEVYILEKKQDDVSPFIYVMF